MPVYPYKFLDPYDAEDRNFFSGRDEEIEELHHMVFESNIILIYGPSGTGKTSLVQCGLAAKLRPNECVMINVRRGININHSLKNELERHAIFDEQGELEKDEDNPLELLYLVYLNYFRPIYLIFDQFEELFVLGERDEQRKFIKTILALLSSKHNLKIFFIVREEYLWHLYEFENAIPQIMRKKLRVEPMNLVKVREVVLKSAGENSLIQIAEGDHERLPKAIFEKLRGKQRSLTIELPYLQVLLDKLYIIATSDQTRTSSATFSISLLDMAGTIDDVLDSFLDEQVDEVVFVLKVHDPLANAYTVWAVLSPFATLEGTKEAVQEDKLNSLYPHLAKNVVGAAIAQLQKRRVLRFRENENAYELMHDSLAKKIALKRTDDEIAIMEVKRLIRSHVNAKTDAVEFLSERQLNFVELYLTKLNFTEEELSLITSSRMNVKKTKRKRTILVAAVIGLQLVGIVAISFFAINATMEKIRAEQLLYNLKLEQTRTNAKQRETTALQYLDNKNKNQALKYIDTAILLMADYPFDSLTGRLQQIRKSCK